MKNKLVVLAAIAGTLLLSSCQKDADSVSPSSSNSSTGTNSAGKSILTSSGDSTAQCPPPKPEKIMADLDLDKDSLLSRSEVKGPLIKDFDKIDKNKDNFISLKELKEARPPKPGCQPMQKPKPGTAS
jgi:hypothetical protein